MAGSPVAALFAYERKLMRGWHYSWRYATYSEDPLRAASMEQAYKLLITMLSARQLNSLLKRGYFDVTLANGHRYRLNPEIASIWLMKKDKRWEHAIQFCLHPNARITPPPDISIQHLMLLATDEKLFLETANHTCSTWYENWLYKRGYTYDEHTKRKVRRSLAR